MTRSERAFVQRVIDLKDEIKAGEWMYQKNENRLCRMFDNTEARAALRAVFNAMCELTL